MRRKRITSVKAERCMNPWKAECGNTDIVLYIFYDGSRVPICRDCWKRIASKKTEWSCD